MRLCHPFAGWLLSAPLKAPRRGLMLGQGEQTPLGTARFPPAILESPAEILSEVLSEARCWVLAANATAAGAARTAPTSTPMMREPLCGVSLHWRGWTWTCVRMTGSGGRKEPCRWFNWWWILHVGPSAAGWCGSWLSGGELPSTRFEERSAVEISPTSN